MEELTGRVAVVTGGASGIGFAMAERFAGEGMKLAIADIEEDALDGAAKQLADGGADVLAVPTDVSKPESVDALADQVVDAIRTGRFLVITEPEMSRTAVDGRAGLLSGGDPALPLLG